MSVPPSPTNAAHLLRRAAWGGRPSEIARVVDDGIEATVDRLFDPNAADAWAAPKVQNGFLPYEHEAVIGWFAHLCVTSSTPAIERLTWFWHGHFATSIEKVELTDLMVQQFAQLRRWGLGRFDDLLTAMANDAAMNLWLDLHLSVKGKPNENFARELLELFSMGAGNGYGQSDVVAAARAFTGHVLELDPRYDRPVGSRINPGLHDRGTKTFLGRTGRFDGGDIVSMIVERPECHRFVAGRFWHRYAGTSASPSVIDDLAQAFARRFEIRDLLLSLFTHPAFYDASVKNGLVAQPVEVAMRTLRGFEVDTIDLADYTLAEIDRDEERLLGGGTWHPADVMEWLAGMGQVPMMPPNVGGWPHNEAWLDSNRSAGRLLAGTEFGRYLVEAETPVTQELRRAAARGGAALTQELMARFGRVSWSEQTGAAIATALDSPSRNGDDGLAAAFAVAFTSPEVTLA